MLLLIVRYDFICRDTEYLINALIGCEICLLKQTVRLDTMSNHRLAYRSQMSLLKQTVRWDIRNYHRLVYSNQMYIAVRGLCSNRLRQDVMSNHRLVYIMAVRCLCSNRP